MSLGVVVLLQGLKVCQIICGLGTNSITAGRNQISIRSLPKFNSLNAFGFLAKKVHLGSMCVIYINLLYMKACFEV
jgi:hypothetical protein